MERPLAIALPAALAASAVVVILAACTPATGAPANGAPANGAPANGAPAASAPPTSAGTPTPAGPPSGSAGREAASKAPVPEPTSEETADVSTEERRRQDQQLIRAAERGNEAAVTRLLDSGAAVTATDRTGRTALVAAAYGNHVAVARRLLASGADPNAKDETVQSAYLISTSEVGDDPRLLRLLLAEGADVESLDSWKGTGLIRAAHRGYWRVIGVLLETPIEIDHINRIGYTALHEAVVLGDGGPAHQRTVAALVKAGVDTSIEDSGGSTALESARARGYDRIVALLD